ncbi:hypothetical protein CC2G_001819 [Coprinopsis cinerea AmutBmut pab1-1]|nr:hypothetical protein CC2G_001819 [Coprinopsis cinerea AmutBmut pab1-1]
MPQDLDINRTRRMGSGYCTKRELTDNIDARLNYFRAGAPDPWNHRTRDPGQNALSKDNISPMRALVLLQVAFPVPKGSYNVVKQMTTLQILTRYIKRLLYHLLTQENIRLACFIRGKTVSADIK